MSGNSSNGGGGGGGPCGACKFLRRKCVKGCIFAPYFDSQQGATHFAAVHKVFGASNVSKLLVRIPVNKRLDTVVTICYEALARIKDPVYGCVGHIFALQQQVVNLQAELAFIQAHLATMERSLPTQPTTTLAAGVSTPNVTTLLDPPPSDQISETANCSWINAAADDKDLDDGDLQALSREFVTRYLPGVRFQPSDSN